MSQKEIFDGHTRLLEWFDNIENNFPYRVSPKRLPVGSLMVGSEVREWLRDNLERNEYAIAFSIVYFRDEVTATMFKLRFG